MNTRMPAALILGASFALTGVSSSAQSMNGYDLPDGLLPLPAIGPFLGEFLAPHAQLIPGGLYEEIMYYAGMYDEYRNTGMGREMARDLVHHKGKYAAAGATPGLRRATLDIERATHRDPCNKRYRFRCGLIGTPVVDVPAPVITDAKGGMVEAAPAAKGVIAAPAPALAKWEVFGDVYYLESDQDQQQWPVFPLLPIAPRAETEMWGTNLGARYALNENWSFGGMIGYADASVDQSVSLLGGLFRLTLFDTDIEMWSISPFVSYTVPDIFPNADLMVDFLYSYADAEYDTQILPLINAILPPGFGPMSMSADGETHTLDLNANLVMEAGNFRHGPFAGLRYIDGEVEDQLFSFPGVILPVVMNGSGFDVESLVSTLGYSVAYVNTGPAGSLVPQLSVAWEHEFEDNTVTFAGAPTSVDEDVLVLGGGLGWYANAGWNLVFNYEGRFGDEFESHLFGLKAGVTF